MAEKKFLVDINLVNNQLKNGAVHRANGLSNIASPVLGQIAFDTSDNKFAVCVNPSSTDMAVRWEKMGTSSSDGHTYALTGSGVTVRLNQTDGGVVSAGEYSIPDASTSDKGVVQLTTSYSSTSTSLVPTASALNSGLGTKAPTSHASTATTYGVGNASNYGHVKLSDSTTSTSSASSGVAATPKAVSDALSSAKSYTDSAVSGIVGPMMFKGTLGTGGSITSLPTASASNVGYVYKVITAGTYSGQAAKIGDMFIGTQTATSPAAYAWTYVPSGDEQGIPTGGSSNQYLDWNSAGTAKWESPISDLSASGATTSTNLITAKAVADAIATAQAGIVIPEQISRQTFTIASGSSSGSVNIGTDKTVFAVTAIQSNSGVVADWTYSNGSVTVTLASNATAAVTVNVLYYGGGTAPSSVQDDFVVEVGSDANWEWRKWNSGKVDCWGSFSHTLAMTVQTGNGWFQSAGLQETFPSGLFNATPKICMFSMMTESGGAICGLEMGGGLSTTKTQQFWAYRVDSSATVSCWIYVSAKGTWK